VTELPVRADASAARARGSDRHRDRHVVL